MTRTRFAPSPTGFLHIGGIRTALFAYLVAKQASGSFILRIEDTDQKREVPGSRDHLISSLKSIGLAYDEGPDKPGKYGPYIQSDRLELYKLWAQKLIDAGRAYTDPYSSEELQALREKAQTEKRAFRYRDHRPENPPAWDGSRPLRFKSEPRSYNYHDEVMGDITTSPEVIDDFILMKSDGYPTYNFAHIIDDAAMDITHVIRGQEFISSMPNYLNLYEALGYDMSSAISGNRQDENASQALGEGNENVDSLRDKLEGRALPKFAHMPHIMNEQGNKKLSKRDGAKDVLDYIRDGYLAETLLSFIATLGWNDGTEQEVFTHDELVKKFSLDRIQRSGARFDERRLLWMNGHFIRQLSIDDLANRIEHFWPKSASRHSKSYQLEVLGLAQDRLKTLKDLGTLTEYFFEEPIVNMRLIDDNKQLKKLSPDERKKLIAGAIDIFTKQDNWTAENIQASLNELLVITNQKPGVLFSLVRIVTTWAPFSPQLDETLALLGKETTLNRLNKALN